MIQEAEVEELEEYTEKFVKTIDETKVVKYSVTMAEIAKLAEQYKEVPTDLTVKANYELVRKAASHLRGLRSDVEKRRKELKADALAWGKLVDGTAKEITEKLVEIEEPFATAKKDFDTKLEIEKREAALAEERRVDGIAERIARIKELVEANFSSSSTVIFSVKEQVLQQALPCDWADEFKEKATTAIHETIDRLTELQAMKYQQEQAATLAAEAEAKRLADEEAARIERERLAEEARLKLVEEQAKLAEERRAMEAEREKLAAEQKARDDKAAAEQKIKDDEAAADRAKLAAEIAELKEQQAEREQQERAEKEAQVVKEAIHEQPATLAPTLQAVKQEQPATHSTGYAEEYRQAGNAMLKIIGNKTVTKILLDAIIKGDVPHIKFHSQEY